MSVSMSTTRGFMSSMSGSLSSMSVFFDLPFL
jgi:hypothetical protein